jgi:hypothetical protein
VEDDPSVSSDDEQKYEEEVKDHEAYLISKGIDSESMAFSQTDMLGD